MSSHAPCRVFYPLSVLFEVETEFLVANNGHCIHVDVEDEGLGGLTFENAWSAAGAQVFALTPFSRLKAVGVYVS